MFLTYPYLVIIFSATYALFFAFQIRNIMPSNSFCTPRQFEMLFLGVTLVLLVLPRIVYAALNPQGFRNPDIFAYMSDSQEVLLRGRIPEADALKQDLYYAPFPAFTLLLSSLTMISGLSTLHSVHVINILIQALFWSSVYLLLNKVCGKVIPPQYVMLGLVAAAYANPYLYGYFNTPLPQTLGLSILLLLLFLRMQRSINHSIIYMIVITIALVHVTVIPVFLLILVALLLSNLLSKTSFVKQANQETNFQGGLYSLLLPGLVFMTYLIYTGAIIPVAHWTEKILLFLLALQEAVLRGQVALTEGLPRGVLTPLNALGPSLVIGATLCYFLIFYLRAMLKHEKSNKWLGSIAMVALMLIFLGTLR